MAIGSGGTGKRGDPNGDRVVAIGFAGGEQSHEPRNQHENQPNDRNEAGHDGPAHPLRLSSPAVSSVGCADRARPRGGRLTKRETVRVVLVGGHALRHYGFEGLTGDLGFAAAGGRSGVGDGRLRRSCDPGGRSLLVPTSLVSTQGVVPAKKVPTLAAQRTPFRVPSTSVTVASQEAAFMLDSPLRSGLSTRRPAARTPTPGTP